MFIHSHKKYIVRSMNLINPNIFTPPAPALTYEAFVAPANFDPDAQELNIVQAFAAYPDANKKYIYSVSPSVASTTLSAVTGRSYAYAENGSSYTIIGSGTVTWTSGSTKRNVVVMDSASSIIANISFGGVWAYVGIAVRGVFSNNNNYLKYIHCQRLISITLISDNSLNNCTGLTGSLTIPNSVTTIGSRAFSGCTGLTGTLTIPNSVTTIGLYAFCGCTGLTGTLTISNSVTTISAFAFNNCSFTGKLTIPNSVETIEMGSFAGNKFTELDLGLGLKYLTGDYNYGSGAFMGNKFTGSLNLPSSLVSIAPWTFSGCTGFTGSLTIPSSVTTIGSRAFSGCTGLTIYNFFPSTAPTITGTPFSSYAKPLHIKAGAAGYNVAPWTDTTIFSSIISDL